VSDRADIVIVGGGIIGCACAFQLARRDLSVVLIERDELAAGASGRNHGLLLNPLDPALAPMAERSLAVYRSAIAESELPVAFDDAPVGFLVVAGDDEAEREAARSEAEAARANGVAAERMTGEEARRLEPALGASIQEAWLLDDGLRVDPAALTVALALRASATGAAIHRHLTARAIRVDGGRATGVVTDVGPIDANTVVVAAGPWTNPLLQRAPFDRPRPLRLPILPYRGWLVQVLPTPGGRLGRLVGRAGWHTLPDSEAVPALTVRDVLDAAPGEPPGTLLQPNPDGTMLVGGSRRSALTNEPEDPTVPRRILEAATAVVPTMADASVISAWWGLRPMTTHGRPFVSEIAPGLLVASGHGGQGVILGGGTAELVAALVTGEAPPFDAAPFRVDLA